MFWSVPYSYAKVLDFSVKPMLAVSQAYIDNIRLQGSNSSQGGLATQLIPSVNVSRDSANMKFNLNYRLQYLVYEGINLDPRLYNQLQMNSKTELYDNSVFLDSTSTMGQGNAGAIGSFTPNNILRSSSIGSTTYRTFRLSPYWQPHLGGYLDGEVRVGYLRFDNTSSINSSNVSQNFIGIGNLGSDSYQESVYFRSGKKMESTGFSGRLSFNNQEQYYRSIGSKTQFRSIDAELSYRLLDDVSVFIQAGYYNNVYSGRATARNGTYIVPGVSWKPSPQFSLAAGYGANAYFANITWLPSQRTSFQLNYRNSQVGGSNCNQQNSFGGLGGSAGSFSGTCGSGSGSSLRGIGAGIGGGVSGFSTGALGAANLGSSWNGSFQHRTKNSTWTVSYNTVTTTLQQLLANQAIFTTPTDANGNPTGEATANDRPTDLPNFTNGVIINKRAQASATWFFSKNSFQATINQSNLSYSTGSYRDQDILSLTASWSYRFNPRMTSTIQGSWQNSSYQTTGKIASKGDSEYLTASLSLSRQLSSFATGTLQFSHYQVDSNNLLNAANILGNLGSYSSSQVTASLNLAF